MKTCTQINAFHHPSIHRSCSIAAAFWVMSAALVGMAVGVPAYGQAGLRSTLEKLDTNDNGKIDPDEITALSRPYLERVYRQKRLSTNRAQDIAEIQEASRIYHAIQNGVAGERVRVEEGGGIRGFEPSSDQEIVPGFGLAEVKYPYVQDDLDEADDTLRRYDRDDDRYIDRREAARARWTHRDPFEMDLDQDGRLSRMELAQRYARRRILDGDKDELIQRARRVGNGIEPSRQDERDRRDSSEWWRKGGSRYWLSASLLSRFDKNRNGRLESSESKELNLPIGEIDVDRNGELSRDELRDYTMSLQETIGDEAEGLPGWFYELDEDRDKQVSMQEFASDLTAGRLQEFLLLDANDDGLLTQAEVANSKAMMGGEFSNETAEPLPPKKTIVSEIQIAEDFTIGDLNVQLSITHSDVSHLDIYLTGPDGQRVELCTEVGGAGDHFNETIFDDQAGLPIVKARPPFEGTFQPEAKIKRQPSLDQFNEKNASGVWQLVVRGTRSDRFGMLHHWSLLIRPKDDLLDPIALASESGDSARGQASTPMGTGIGNDRERQQQFDRSRAYLEAMQRSKEAAARESTGFKADKKKGWDEDAVNRFRQWAETQKQLGKPITAESKRAWFGKGGKGG
ncbi:MAG: proprotein convertase P-domain-containing protein, partial [Planctomycetota bacterium]